MRNRRFALATAIAAIAAFALAGCMTSSVSSFTPMADQQAVTRDGIPSLMSRKTDSIVLVRQAQRQQNANGRRSYVIGILNLSKAPINFAFSGISVTQTFAAANSAPLRTYSYDDLVKEEKEAEFASAVLIGLAGAASAAAASNAGYYHGNAAVSGPYGVSHVSYTGYNPTAAAIAQTNVAMQNEAMIDNAVEAGKRDMAMLENTIIKDDTIMPGEWYGGTVQFDPPGGSSWPKTFTISVEVGSELHEVQVTETLPG
jgi:hypothetical protein